MSSRNRKTGGSDELGGSILRHPAVDVELAIAGRSPV
jgi:hypothetical protein